MSDHADASAFPTLVRYFFSSFFRLSFLDDAGEESFKRGLIGVLSAVLALGLLLVRLYVGRYAGVTDPDVVSQMLGADRLLMIALPTFVVTLVMALVSHSVFPDELDFRILMALPLKRRTVFAGKFAALALFLALFAGGVSIGMVAPLSLLTNTVDHSVPLIVTTLVQIGLAIWGCALAVMLVVALEGAIAVLLPKAWMRPAAVWLQTTMVGAMVLVLPWLLRVPGAGAILQERPAWILVLPPMWLLGVEEWLLGYQHPSTQRLVALAVSATALLAVGSVGATLAVYRRFDHSVFRPASARKPGVWRMPVRLPGRWPERWPGATHPAAAAVRDFMAATLRRSGLHQLVFVSLVAIGIALATNSVLGAMALSQRWWVRAALGTPFTLMAGAVVGLRTALLLPTNLRASWIFRFTETDAHRRYQLDAVRRAMLLVGVVLPALMALPLVAGVLGVPAAARLAPLMVMIGWVFTEAVCYDWRRIPFTCTFMFAKRPPAYTVFLVVMIFGWFVFFGTSLLDTARQGVVQWLLVAVLVSSVGVTLRSYRRQQWGRWPLEFEDYVPDAFETLTLGQ